jgi:hypothetical protein
MTRKLWCLCAFFVRRFIEVAKSFNPWIPENILAFGILSDWKPYLLFKYVAQSLSLIPSFEAYL